MDNNERYIFRKHCEEDEVTSTSTKSTLFCCHAMNKEQKISFR